MIRPMRHGSPPRLMALQSILSPNRRESLPTPSAGVRMMRVEQVGLVKRLALTLVDRSGVAVPDTRKLGCRPDHLARRRARRSIEASTDQARGAVDRRDCAGVAVVNARAFQGVGELHTVADGERVDAMRRVEAMFAPELAALNPNLTQRG